MDTPGPLGRGLLKLRAIGRTVGKLSVKKSTVMVVFDTGGSGGDAIFPQLRVAIETFLQQVGKTSLAEPSLP
jgi:hypothetical protein